METPGASSIVARILSGRAGGPVIRPSFYSQRRSMPLLVESEVARLQGSMRTHVCGDVWSLM
jgi:hypothetical protein